MKHLIFFHSNLDKKENNCELTADLAMGATTDDPGPSNAGSFSALSCNASASDTEKQLF